MGDKVKIHESPCAFCGSTVKHESGLAVKSHFKSKGGGYDIWVYVLESSYDNGRFDGALSRVICLPCLKEFVSKSEKYEPKKDTAG